MEKAPETLGEVPPSGGAQPLTRQVWAARDLLSKRGVTPL